MNYPDYSKYSLTDLYDVLNLIDKESYPERIKIVEEEIKKRLASGSDLPQKQDTEPGSSFAIDSNEASVSDKVLSNRIGFGRRFGAAFVDSLIVGIPMLIISIIIMFSSGFFNMFDKTGIERSTTIEIQEDNGSLSDIKALMSAAGNGNTDSVRIMLDKGIDVNVKYKNGQTALMKAAESGFSNTVELLIKNGADVDAKGLQNNTALMFASMHGYTDVVLILLESGADVNIKGINDWTASMWAALNGHRDIVEILKEAGAEDETNEGSIGMITFITSIGVYLLLLLYSLIEGLTGASPGKMILGLKIGNENGSRADSRQLLSRWFVKNIELVLWTVGAITAVEILWDMGSLLGFIVFIGCFFVLGQRKQSFHDSISKTAVYSKAILIQHAGLG